MRAKLDNAGQLHQLLAPIAIQEMATCFVEERGLRFVGDQHGLGQSSSLVPRQLFSEYTPQLPPPPPKVTNGDDDGAEPPVKFFTFNIKDLLHCLNMFGSASAGQKARGVKRSSSSSSSAAEAIVAAAIAAAPGTLALLEFNEASRKFVVTLEKGGVRTHCEFATAVGDIHLTDAAVPARVAFTDDEPHCQVLMGTEYFMEAIKDIEPTAPHLEIAFNTRYPYLRISADGGSLGTVETLFGDDTDVIQSCVCPQPMSQKYLKSILAPMKHALEVSTTVSMRMNSDGLLALQFILPIVDYTAAFIEFLWSPVADIDGSDSGADDGDDDDEAVETR